MHGTKTGTLVATAAPVALRLRICGKMSLDCVTGGPDSAHLQDAVAAEVQLTQPGAGVDSSRNRCNRALRHGQALQPRQSAHIDAPCRRHAWKQHCDGYR